MDKILSFISIGIYVFLIFCRTSTAADTLIFKHGSFQLGFLHAGVYRRLLASTSGDYCNNDGLCGANGIEIARYHKFLGQSKYEPHGMQSKLLEQLFLYGLLKLRYQRKVSGCTTWFGDLINIRKLLAGGGQDLYIRIPASELNANCRKTKIAVIVVSIASVVSGTLLAVCCIRRKSSKFKEKMGKHGTMSQNYEGQKEDLEVPLFSLSTIATATNNFSFNKKLGEGGFGPVYKGRLVDGQEIAVKRLSQSSGQGSNEFKTEVRLIAKLQHRNLVRLLGCCIEGEEKLLIYEYMPNKSLDFYIFDQTQGRLLYWSKRFHIICGIARGLLYLHQDSRLRIIHRDLKASNVLLDKEMNPKISDFGLAKTFGGDQNEGVTRNVVGTYGYMAPEYAIDGQFSVKSDVFSFGILLLEIVSGKRNRGFYDPDENLNLIGHARHVLFEA
ncbi:G-type lectin S-receptor-like serine/threonine-protein kinase SD1-1 [Prunus yedoensis var. nudiflora]|uniref:non-specific serine/threonine protein kinase n=1 Tax=Prunus yedoensis var. nudiflora TaxID=2094558 RepID=A0A314YP32_PRUYE|nr:G-type lectin S-receptor-like serine/threonine-protein kinase SD1-1 [Prunus yedoensis var. nudiflora]